MRQYSKCFLLLLLILFPAVAEAEMVAGTVLSVNRAQGTIVFRTDTQQELLIQTDISPLPGRVTAGKRIRIWGSYKPGSNYFTATDIRGPGKNIHRDPTGVRARISKRKHCRNCTNDNTFDDNGDNIGHGNAGPGSGGGNGNGNGGGGGGK